MPIEKMLIDAVTSAGWEITQRPVTGGGDRYASFELTRGTPRTYASDDIRSIRWTLTLDLWSREAIVSPEAVALLRALREHGLHASAWGPDVYESDTGWHHFPMTITVGEKL